METYHDSWTIVYYHILGHTRVSILTSKTIVYHDVRLLLYTVIYLYGDISYSLYYSTPQFYFIKVYHGFHIIVYYGIPWYTMVYHGATITMCFIYPLLSTRAHSISALCQKSTVFYNTIFCHIMLYTLYFIYFILHRPICVQILHKMHILYPQC